MPPPPEQVPADLEIFTEENRMSPPVGSPAQENAGCVFCERHSSPAWRRESVGDICAAPGISVRGATSANNRIGYRAADGRFRRRQRGRCSYGAELRKFDS